MLQCGSKERMSVMSPGGTEEVEVDENKAQTFCLSDEHLLHLANIGLKVCFYEHPLRFFIGERLDISF